uniref:NAD(P)-binding domain-containing protein n=1 Tax=Bionectria ochroleuca TaxID=29856 RepID=A0A8H7NFT6_BIOOC
MRIALAGDGGLGYLLASQISRAKSAHNVLVLSRTPKPIYESLDIQVQIVDYFNPESLQYALRGVDLVISTVSGREQINLILAAGEGTVRHFVPAEFEGKLWQRPPWDGSTAGSSAEYALALLQTFENRNLMKYTVFSCGVLMEIFHPLGLGSFDMGFRAGVSGSFLLNIPEATAEYVAQNAQGQPRAVYA